MFEIIEDVIKSGDYALSDILKKIDTIWVKGDLTDEEREKLIALAREGADYTAEVNIIKEITEIKERLMKLESGTPVEPGEEYPEYVVGKWYYRGDKITFDGKCYICDAPEGQVCTWSPVEYPAYWKEVKEW